jgi:hypothetical protein
VGQLPPVVWLAAIAVALVVCALCVGTAVLVTRAPARRRIARWRATLLLELIAAAAVPWLIVLFAPIAIRVSIHGLAQLVGWILVALLAFALLVLLPLAAVASSLVWWTARRTRIAASRGDPPSEPFS